MASCEQTTQYTRDRPAVSVVHTNDYIKCVENLSGPGIKYKSSLPVSTQENLEVLQIVSMCLCACI